MLKLISARNEATQLQQLSWVEGWLGILYFLVNLAILIRNVNRSSDWVCPHRP